MSRSSGWSRVLALWLGAGLFGLAWGGGLLDDGPAIAGASGPAIVDTGRWSDTLASRASDKTSTPTKPDRRDSIRGSFGFCHSGGGRNCVVDGDTFHMDGEKIRIAGIDAPETHPSRCAEEARLGDAATTQLHDLLNSGPVRLVPIDRDRDRYGRLLRNVSIGGSDVGAAMIAAGVARSYGRGRQPWCD